MAQDTIAIIGNQGASLVNFRGDLIKDLVRRGYRVVALAPEMDKSANKLREIGAEPVSIWLSRTGINPLGDFLGLLLIAYNLIKIRPSVVLSYTAKPVIYGTLAAWIAHVPRRYAMIEGLGYVFIQRSHDKITSKILRIFVTFLYRFALKYANKVLFLNNDDALDFISLKLVSSNKADTIGGIGVDLSIWQNLPAHTNPITFTYVGRILRDKGILDFVAAASIIKKRAPQARFLVLGQLDSNPSSISRDEVESWVKQGTLEWLGHVNIEKYLAETSVFVLPSYREGLPRSTQEAMACGRPVITTDAPGCRDTVIDGKNGFLVNPGNIYELSLAMQNFIDNPGLIHSMGFESRKIAEEKFDVLDANRRIMNSMKLIHSDKDEISR